MHEISFDALPSYHNAALSWRLVILNNLTLQSKSRGSRFPVNLCQAPKDLVKKFQKISLF